MKKYSIQITQDPDCIEHWMEKFQCQRLRPAVKKWRKLVLSNMYYGVQITEYHCRVVLYRRKPLKIEHTLTPHAKTNPADLDQEDNWNRRDNPMLD